MDFIMNNIEIILAVIGIVILVVLWLIGRKDVVKSILLQMVIDAEAKYGSGTGGIKHDTVVGLIKQKFPTLFTIISDKTLDKWIEDMVKYIKEELGEETIQKAGNTTGVNTTHPDGSNQDF